MVWRLFPASKDPMRKRSLLLSLENAFETLSISAPTVMDALRGRLTREASDRRLASWSARVVANAAITIDTRGQENVDPAATYLVMSNHQSHYDIAVLYSVLGSSIRMIAKRELFDVPIFGRAMREAGFISLDRQNRSSALQSLDDAKAKLASGISIWIAPEGTRSQTGELLPFKKGGFAIAQATGTTILPLSIQGTRDVLQANALRSRAGCTVSVTIHPPIDPTTFTGEPKASREALIAAVRGTIARGL